ncbi:MAG: ABC transporter ATP-binding protein [Phycisphaerae bacterium]|nr:ABC transporter ATP-binding protein [Phycisphaerae bacterium]
MIELADIDKTYGVGDVTTQVLKGISFCVEKGEYVAIMGASGTGKTTLMNLVGLLDKPTAGQYRLEDNDVVTLDDEALSHLRNRKIGFVFQQFHLLDRANALRNVMLPLIYADRYPEDAEDRAKKALEAVGLADRMHYNPNKLSGGQQQRVAIARALINDPAIILADEPTGNLDSKSGIEILAIFKRLHKQGRIIIVITHDNNVAEHADRIIVLKDGQIAEDKPIMQPRDAETELKELNNKEGQS